MFCNMFTGGFDIEWLLLFIGIFIIFQELEVVEVLSIWKCFQESKGYFIMKFIDIILGFVFYISY